MKKYIYASLAILLILSGCGGGAEKKITTSKETADDKSTIKVVVGKYNLWEYLVPSSTVKYDRNTQENGSYGTLFTKNGDTVTETSDYAKDEKILYTKNSSHILVSFEKDGKANGEYSLNLTVNLDEMITVKESTCKLTTHFENKEINNKTYQDLIEINCNGKTGYYQRDVGEIVL